MILKIIGFQTFVRAKKHSEVKTPNNLKVCGFGYNEEQKHFYEVEL